MLTPGPIFENSTLHSWAIRTLAPPQAAASIEKIDSALLILTVFLQFQREFADCMWIRRVGTVALWAVVAVHGVAADQNTAGRQVGVALPPELRWTNSLPRVF